MTAELPSINSTTSISDNVDLRNYYDNLLFKNNSGKSLTDLPRKAAAAAAGMPPYGKNPHALSNEVMASGKDEGAEKDEKKINFITGYENAQGIKSAASHRLPFTSFQMTPSNSEPIPPSATPGMMHSQSLGRPQHGFFNVSGSNTVAYHAEDPTNIPPFSFDFDRSNEPSGYYSSNLAQSFASRSMMSSVEPSNAHFVEPQQQQLPLQNDLIMPQSHFHSQQAHSGARRSSYISDTLIHGHMGSVPNPEIMNSMNSQAMKPVGFPTSSSQMAPPTTAPAAPYKNMIPQHYPPRRNTQPVNSLGSATGVPFNQQPLANNTVRNRYLNYPKQQPHHGKAVTRDETKGEVLLENGLILVNAHQIVSSPDLQALYADCGTNYFSSSQVYEFTEHIKSMLRTNDTPHESKKTQAVTNFLTFLKSCNLNYNPQSDAFVSEKQISSKSPIDRKTGLIEDASHAGKQTTQEKRSNSASSYLHYKPLVLVALKNGKLELLSTPQNTNILMKRDDLVIIDGDRGKDLALVVEPVVDLDLALFVNFLKKKIHFDSLITSKSQHHANDTFVQALIDSTKGQSEELNSKLYDVIELTQLIVPSKQVLRFATPWEVTTNLHNKFQDELKALHIAQLKLKSLNSGFTHHHHHNGANNGTAPVSAGHSTSRPQLNIKILNAEFQFDRKKLTFYYVCEERNDFRELIKELFKFYKTRIWLCAIPNNLGIDAKYYDSQRKELKMYQEMMQHYATEDLADTNGPQGGGFIVAPPLNKIELDNFQIGVYKELVDELFH